MTGGKAKQNSNHINRSNIAIRKIQSTKSSAHSTPKVKAPGESLGIAGTLHSSAGRAIDFAPSDVLSERLMPHARRDITMATLLLQGPSSSAGLVASINDGNLQRAIIDRQLLWANAAPATGLRGQNSSYLGSTADLAARMTLANSSGGGHSSLELHNWLSRSSSLGMFPSRVDQSDQFMAEIASLHGQIRYDGNAVSDAAIIASLIAQEPARTAPLALSTTSSATATRQLLGSLLRGQQTESVCASESLPQVLPDVQSFHLRQQPETTGATAATATERQLLQLYLLERERQLHRQNLLGNGGGNQR